MPPPNSMPAPAGAFVPTITISSPAAGNTLPQRFTAAGQYTLGGGTLQNIECQLLKAGTTTGAEPAVNGTADPRRLVWSADIATTQTGTFDLVARIFLTTGESAEVTVAGIIIDAAPLVTIAQPAPAVDAMGTAVGVQLAFKPGHTITQVDVEVVDSADVWQSRSSARLNGTVVSWGPLAMSGFAGEDHRVRIVARNSAGPDITLSAGAVLLS